VSQGEFSETTEPSPCLVVNYMVSKPIKILQVITLSEIGGAQRVVFDIVRGLHNDPAFFFEVACAPGGELVGWLKGLGVRVYEIPELVREISPSQDIQALACLRSLIKRNKYDLVHCHSSKAGILGRWAAWRAGVSRIIFTVHGWIHHAQPGWYKRMLFAWMERAAGMISTDLVCVSRADMERGRQYVNWKKLHLIHNGVEEPGRSPGKLRRIIGVGAENIIVGMAARLKGPKEPLFFLQVAEYFRHRDNVQFVLIGDGPLGEQCRQYIKDRSLPVHLLGTRPDLSELYGDMDIFTLFSSWEGLPLTICEAMRAGLPVVASRVGGVEEQVTQGWNGFLLDPGNVQKAVKYIDQLAADPLLRREMGGRGKERAGELFAVERMVEQYKKLYLNDRAT